jgi:hypothetical protein
MLLKLFAVSAVPPGCTTFWLTDGLTDTPPAPPLGVAGAYCPDDEEYVSTCPFAGDVDPTGTL